MAPAQPEPNAPSGRGSGRVAAFMKTGHDVAREELQHWSARRIATVSALWVCGAIVLAIMAVFAHQYPEFPGDVGLAVWIQQLHQPFLVRFINFASDANWPDPAGITAIVIVLLLILLRHVRAAICALVAGFGADFINVTLNGIVARPRPHNVHIHTVAHLGLHSFPSGHVTHVIAFYGFLLYLTFQMRRAHPTWTPWLRAVQVICLYFIIFIGPSRVLEGEHWPSDVLASYLIGGLMLVVAIALYHLLGFAWVRYHESHYSAVPDADSPLLPPGGQANQAWRGE